VAVKNPPPRAPAIVLGDVLQVLRSWPSEFVQCVVTSPPYWGLRDYGIPPSVWGGDPGHEHAWAALRRIHKGGKRYDPQPAPAMAGRDQSARNAVRDVLPGSSCACGAWLGNLGLEPTPEDFVAHLVEVFREVRRVLKKDGTLWLNLGDCYASKAAEPHADKGTFENGTGSGQGCTSWTHRGQGTMNTVADGLKAKDLVGAPWMAAFALRADGWYLRSDVVWSKRNPMPESVTDRPTKAHEYLFLMAKSQRYFYDADAIKEKSVTGDPRRPYGSEGSWIMDGRAPEKRGGGKVRSPAGWKTGPGSHGSIHEDGREKAVTYSDQVFATRNVRSVWEMSTEPFPEAHFATFPEAIPTRCLLAGSKRGDVVLDPFSGSGTVAAVAKRLGRRCLGIELNPEYLAMAERRVAAEPEPPPELPGLERP
jgi:DNA modification methylase